MTELNEMTTEQRNEHRVRIQNLMRTVYVDTHLDRLKATRQGAVEKVAADGNTGWSVVDDLIKGYGADPIVHFMERMLEKLELGEISQLEMVTAFRERAVDELCMTRYGQSTSPASTMIEQATRVAWADLGEASKWWIQYLQDQ